MDNFAWFLTKRFSVRSSISADRALTVELELMGPEEVLRAGGVEWKAELVETKPINHAHNAAAMANTQLPNHAVISSIVPKQTAVPRKEGAGDTIEFTQASTLTAGVPAEILATDTIYLHKDADSAPKFPCPKLYLHLVVREVGVPIPPPKLSQEISKSTLASFFRLAEMVFGSLSQGERKEELESEGEGGGLQGSAPIHITLERLYFGGLPETALGMGGLMVIMLGLGWLVVRPWLEGALPKAGKLGKDE